MEKDQQIEEWRQDARKQPPGTYGYIEVGSGATAWFQRDKVGRARKMEGEQADGLGVLLPPGWRRRFPHPIYAYGYERAAAHEYEVLTGKLFLKPSPWLEAILNLAGDLTVQNGPEGPYRHWVAYCQDIAKTAREARPALVSALEPIARRHGLDVMPWGMGWIVRHFLRVQPGYMPDPEPPMGPPRGQRVPATDALLLYVYLTGHLWDPQARTIVKPVIDLDTVADPVRRVQEIKSALGAKRRAGRPPGRSHQATDEVYELLRSQVRYLKRYGWTRT